MNHRRLSFRSILLILLIIVSGTLSAQTWTSQFVSTSNWRGISFSDSLNATMVSDVGKIYRTTNGGASWTAQTSGLGVSNGLLSVHQQDSTRATAVGLGPTGSIILRTTDAGTTWAHASSGELLPDGLNAVAFADSTHGIAGGINYFVFGGVFLSTTDGGTNWSRQTISNYVVYGVSFPDINHAYAVGYTGMIARSTNGGATWGFQTSGTPNTLISVSFTDANHGTAVGSGGTILRTTNGGTTWTAQSSGTTTYLRGVSFIDSLNGTVIGDGGTILRTQDGGANWMFQQSNSSTYLYSVAMTTKNKVIVGATGGLILSTTNGSATTNPTATTNAASAIDILQATVNGTVNPQGASTTVRFVYGTISGSYTDSVTATQSPIVSLSNTAVSASLTGLSPNTTYYVRVAASNFLAYVRGGEVNFTTIPIVLPSVTTGAASAVDFASATLAGSVNTHGATTIVRFLRGTTSGNYTDSVDAVQSPLKDSTAGTVSAGIAGLDTGTVYYYRVAAVNDVRYARGLEKTFSTRAIKPPTISTSAATAIGPYGATLRGTLNSHGVTTSVRFVWGTVSNTYTDSSDAAESPVTDSTSSTLSAAITGLNELTTYYVRVAAENSAYYVRGGQISFTTSLLTAPGIWTVSAAPTGTTTANVNGLVLTYSTSTTVRFLYGTSSNTYSDSVLAVESPLSGAANQTVSASLTGLSPNTTYYVAAAASNGTFSAVGSERSFTTFAGSAGGSALSFNGSDDYVVTDLTDLSGDELTIEYWFKGSTPQSAVRQQTNDGYVVAGWAGPPPLLLLSNDGGVGGGLQVGDAVTDGKWHHVAMTWKRNTVDGYTSYLDGNVNIQRSSSDDPILNLTDPVYLGSYAGSDEFTNGELDEVRIWSVARTQQQIQFDMYHELSGSPSGLLASFSFNEGSGFGTTSLGGAHSGGLYNDTWVSSTAPIGTTTFVSDFSTGTATFGSFSLTTTEDFDNSLGLAGTTITVPPSSMPAGAESIVGNKYFVIAPSTNPGSFTADVTITFGAGVLDPLADGNPGSVKLFESAFGGNGGWTDLGGAASANSSTGVVTWNGITTIGQFAAAYDQTALPVELTNFHASSSRLSAELTWATATEVNNAGFDIERKSIGNLPAEVRLGTQAGRQSANANWSKVGFVQGHGTSTTSRTYSFSEQNLAAGHYAYRLKQIDQHGSSRYSAAAEVEVGLAPLEFALGQNFPNPFNPTTTIEFSVPSDGQTTLKVYDILGREVATLVNEVARAGVYHQATFTADRLATGVYIARLEFGGKALLKKLLLMK